MKHKLIKSRVPDIAGIWHAQQSSFILKFKALTLSLFICISILILCSCNNSRTNNPEQGTNEQREAFQSKNINGQWSTDKSTAMELRAMQSTMENFNLLIRKQPQNLNAYRGYAGVLEMHINRTVTYCSLDQNAKSLLCKDLEKIKEQISIINGQDIVQAREASGKIDTIFAHINSLFDFGY